MREDALWNDSDSFTSEDLFRYRRKISKSVFYLQVDIIRFKSCRKHHELYRDTHIFVTRLGYIRMVFQLI